MPASQAIPNIGDRNCGIRNESPCRTMPQGDTEIKSNSHYLISIYLLGVSRVSISDPDDMLRRHAMHRWP